MSSIEVGGSYIVADDDGASSDEAKSKSKSKSKNLRLVVSFDYGKIEFLDGLVRVDIDWLFDLRANLLQNGSKVAGWLETTYVDDTIRIGRGNRGSLFILSRG